MPELPDLTVFAKNLKKSVLGIEIVGADVHNAFKVNAATETFRKKLAGGRIEDIVRDGKELVFGIDNGNAFSVHLMLSGRFSLCESGEVGSMEAKIVSVDFSDGLSLVVSDYQRLCKVTLNPKPSKVPDVFSEAFTYEYFLAKAERNESRNVKEFIITQGIMRGIGNAYADEILYKANLSPENFVGRIPAERLRDLYNAIRPVLLDAIENIERISPDIISGEERSFLRVHDKNKKVTEQGDKIEVKMVAGKKTYFTQKQERF